MFNKVFEYAGSHKKSIYLASFIMLISVIMGVLPFLFAYQIINPCKAKTDRKRAASSWLCRRWERKRADKL